MQIEFLGGAMAQRNTIGQLARRAGVNVETVRFYERRGLIQQPPTPTHGFRQYDDTILHRILFIKRAQNLGFTLAEIASLLDLSAEKDCDAVRTSAEEKLQMVRQKLEDLRRVEEALGQVVATCRERTADSPCPLLAALGQEKDELSARL